MSSEAAPGRVRNQGAEPTPTSWNALEASHGSAPASPDAIEAAAGSATASRPTLDNTTLESSLAAGLRRLSQWVHTRGWSLWASRRLTPTQLKVLDLLGSRRQGLSLTQVARELGTTAATICDCVGALKEKGFVTRKRNPQDGREKTLRLTPAGLKVAHEAVKSDPLLEVFASLSVAEQQMLQVLSMKMIYGLESSGALPPSRMCVRCQYFQPFFEPHSETPHYCGLAQQPLNATEVRFDCPVFEAADEAAQAALWEAFVDGTAQRRAAEEGFPPHREPAAPPSSDGTVAQ